MFEIFRTFTCTHTHLHIRTRPCIAAVIMPLFDCWPAVASVRATRLYRRLQLYNASNVYFCVSVRAFQTTGLLWKVFEWNTYSFIIVLNAYLFHSFARSVFLYWQTGVAHAHTGRQRWQRKKNNKPKDENRRKQNNFSHGRTCINWCAIRLSNAYTSSRLNCETRKVIYSKRA